MKEYSIQRKEDGHWITSRNISTVDNGIWINDDLETGNKGTRIFLPFHNINQINEYEIENEIV